MNNQVFFFFFWISTRYPGQGLTNPGGAQALGKEFPASAPWLIHGLCPSLMAPWNCLHLARVELIKCSLFLVFCQVARLNKSCLEHTLTMGLWRTWTTHVPLDSYNLVNDSYFFGTTLQTYTLTQTTTLLLISRQSTGHGSHAGFNMSIHALDLETMLINKPTTQNTFERARTQFCMKILNKALSRVEVSCSWILHQ